MDDLLHFEDFQIGDAFDCGTVSLSAADIVGFATEYDPQPMHLDPEAARESLLGGLAASGWHVCAIVMRMFYDGVLARAASEGGPGVDEVRWRAPTRPDVALTLRVDVVDARLSRSRPTIGVVSFQFLLVGRPGRRLRTALAGHGPPPRRGAGRGGGSAAQRGAVVKRCGGAGVAARGAVAVGGGVGLVRRRRLVDGSADRSGRGDGRRRTDPRLRASIRSAAYACGSGGGAPESVRRPLRERMANGGALDASVRRRTRRSARSAANGGAADRRRGDGAVARISRPQMAATSVRRRSAQIFSNAARSSTNAVAPWLEPYSV